MKVYKDINSKYIFFPDYIGIEETLIICEETEVENIIYTNNKIQDCIFLLNSTDHKFYGDYEPKVDEDLEAIRAKRSEARAFVRDNKETK